MSDEKYIIGKATNWTPNHLDALQDKVHEDKGVLIDSGSIKTRHQPEPASTSIEKCDIDSNGIFSTSHATKGRILFYDKPEPSSVTLPANSFKEGEVERVIYSGILPHEGVILDDSIEKIARAIYEESPEGRTKSSDCDIHKSHGVKWQAYEEIPWEEFHEKEKYRNKAKAALSVITTPRASFLELDIEKLGHNQPCYYCGEPCDKLTGNPGKWPVILCHKDEPGVPKFHHQSCVSARLEQTPTRNDEELVKAIKSCDAEGYVIDSKINERCYAVPLPVWKQMIKIFDKIQAQEKK